MVFDDQDEPSPDEMMGEEQTKKIFSGFKEKAKPIFDYMKGGLKRIKTEIGLADKISYEEVMQYIIAHQDDSPAIVKGALLRETTENGIVITQVFLDKDNKLVTGKFGVPLGYKKNVAQLDDELLHLFKDENLIIVE